MTGSVDIPDGFWVSPPLSTVGELPIGEHREPVCRLMTR
jgi:hypothetical protein